MKRLFTTLAAFAFACAAHAQQYPERIAPGVNDFADIIDEETEGRVVARLAEIAADHDTEVVVATLSSLRFYAQDSTIEAYLEGLFNSWAIGNAERNDGLMILVFRDDREVRVQAGAGYDAAAQDQIARVVAEDILPSFREGNLAAGLETGVNGLLARVIDPPVANAAAPAGDAPKSNTLYYILGGIAAAIAGLVGLSRYNKAKFAKEPCPSCGKTGLQKQNVVLIAATLDAQGEGETRISCPSCGHVTATTYTIAKLSPPEPTGGGQTKGDGATGKW